MKAVRMNEYGGPEMARFTDMVVEPVPGEGQVLVEVHAAGLNPFDSKLRQGYMKDAIPLQFPLTPGGDFAGVVKASASPDFQLGDEVFGTALVLAGGSGALAEYAVAGIKRIARKPQKASYVESAAAVLSGVSAVQALEEHIKLSEGQKILIHGGAGGIGSMAIQLAKSMGGHVVTTVNADDMEFVKGLGADEVIDYKKERFEEKLKDLDAVYDPVGGETMVRSFQVLKKGGVLVSMLGQPDPKFGEKYGVTAIGQATKTNTRHLMHLAELIDSGKIKVQIDKVFPLEQIREAFEHLEKGSPRGKVVVKVK